MTGIVLLDESQLRNLYRTTPYHQQEQQQQPPSSRRHRQRPPVPEEELRTDFTTKKPTPLRNFQLSNERCRTATDGTDRTTSPSFGSLWDLGEDAANLDSYPMLDPLDQDVDSSDEDTQVANARLYAGSSSGTKISVRWILLGLFLGISLGLLLSERRVTPLVARWVLLPGDLFVNMLNCLVLPYVFCSVAVAVGDIVYAGKASAIGWQTAKVYLIFWLSSAVMGLAVALMCRSIYKSTRGPMGNQTPLVELTCPDGSMLTPFPTGVAHCSRNVKRFTEQTMYAVEDVNRFFVSMTKDTQRTNFSAKVLAMMYPLVSNNIFLSFFNGDLQSVITFSIVLGVVAGRSYFAKTRRINYIYLLLLQFRNTFFLMMEWTVLLSPFAVMSLAAGALAYKPGILSMFGITYSYLMVILLAAVLQTIVLYPLIVFLMTRCNPYPPMRSMAKAYTFAFASASSLATMPVTLSCIRRARLSSQSITNFVISIGVSSSSSAIAFYVPIALVFMAESSGNGHLITPMRMMGVFVLSFLNCAGTPPVPAAGLFTISTAYYFLFGDLPQIAYGHVVVMDFFVDRIVTACNVNDDFMALRVVSETTDETVAKQ